MINPKQLKSLIIEPVLKTYDLYSEAAVNLLLGTCAQESRMGYYLKQVKGPALGIYQMEPATHNDILQNMPEYREVEKVRPSPPSALIFDLTYATILCRLQYWRFPEPLPKANDLEGLAKYWKKYYNTEKGKGTVEQFVRNYYKYVG